jgi:DNA-binding CsgD family transcriptional regulator
MTMTPKLESADHVADYTIHVRFADGTEGNVELAYGDDASRLDIAEALGMTVDGVKTLLRRAKAKLRTCIHNRLKDPR